MSSLTFRHSLVTALFLFATLILGCRKEEDPKKEDPLVTANENIFINEVYASGNDWFELYNNTDQEKEIGGYKVYDDPTKKYTLPANVSIPARGYLIIFCDDTGTGLNTSFKLTSSGETIYLENKSGQVIDKVAFPALANNQSYARFPDGSATLSITGNVTQGSSNGNANAPAYVSVSRSPLVPTKEQSVTVRAQLLSETGITAVKTYYRIDGGSFTAIDMVLSAGSYVGTIPALNALGTVEYYVEATNAAGNSTRHPNTAPSKTHRYIINEDALPNLVINEFMAWNSSCCPDTDGGTPEFDDWIEIYNAGGTAVDIGGFYFSDDKSNPFNSKIPTDQPAKTTIQPGQFLLIWADGTRSQDPLHVDFALSNAGEDVGIYYFDGRKIDEYTFGAQQENKSTGRSTNGGATWVTFSSPTPGQSNN